jgi:FkbM family methyltransferase
VSIKTDELLAEVIEEKLLGGGKGAQELSGDINVAMLDSLDKMNKTSVNRSYRDIPAAGFKGKLTRLVKRLMRRLTFWYVEPCMMQQTEYNCANNIFSAHTNSEINTLRSKTDTLSGQITELTRINERLDASERLNAELSETIRELRGRLDTMDKQMYIISGGADVLSRSDTADLTLSFSQSGEDAIIRYIFRETGVEPGKIRYLDLGANHAVHLSNTYSFYIDGARGVLLDANPVLAKELTEKREGDIVINKCLSDKPDTKLDFYIMSGDGLSTTDYEAAQSFIRENPDLSIKEKITVDSITLDEIIRDYFHDKAPELMNIDIEGMELTVLKMTDFEKFRPMIIICEMIDYSRTLTVGEKNQEILDFMRSVDYEEFAFTGINSIFIDKRFREGR